MLPAPSLYLIVSELPNMIINTLTTFPACQPPIRSLVWHLLPKTLLEEIDSGWMMTGAGQQGDGNPADENSAVRPANTLARLRASPVHYCLSVYSQCTVITQHADDRTLHQLSVNNYLLASNCFLCQKKYLTILWACCRFNKYCHVWSCRSKFTHGAVYF